MSTTPIKIFRRQDKTLVDALLHDELAPKVLLNAEKKWGPSGRGTWIEIRPETSS